MAPINDASAVSSNGNDRTFGAIMLRTLAIRLAVIVAQATLCTLQGRRTRKTRGSFTARLLMYLLFPLIPVADWIFDLWDWLRCFWDADAALCTPKNIRFGVLQIAGFHLRTEENGSLLEEPTPLRLCIETTVIKKTNEDGGKDWIWRAGQVLLSLGVMTQSIGTIFLIVHRGRTMEESLLLLDIWNAFAACAGALAGLLSITIIAFMPYSEMWTYPRVQARIPGPPHDVSHLRLPFRLVLRERLYPPLMAAYLFSIFTLEYLGTDKSLWSVLWTWFYPGLPWKTQKNRFRFGMPFSLCFWLNFIGWLGPLGLTLTVMFFGLLEIVNQWVASIGGLIEAAYYKDLPVNWNWNDPLSDQLFVY